MANNLPDKDLGCHRTGFEKKCRELVCGGICNRWIQISGENPNTGEAIHHYDCVDNWMPLLTIENTQQARQMGAAIESFRNEMLKANEVHASIGVAMLENQLKSPSQKTIGHEKDDHE